MTTTYVDNLVAYYICLDVGDVYFENRARLWIIQAPDGGFTLYDAKSVHAAKYKITRFLNKEGN